MPLATMLLALAFLAPIAIADDDLIELEERALQAAVSKVAPSVVRIETFGTV
jgi:hypothetical protein